MGMQGKVQGAVEAEAVQGQVPEIGIQKDIPVEGLMGESAEIWMTE